MEGTSQISFKIMFVQLPLVVLFSSFSMAAVVAHRIALGLNDHILQFKNYLAQGPILPDVICNQETFLNIKNKTPKIQNYNVIRMVSLNMEDRTIHSPQKCSQLYYCRLRRTRK